MWWQDAYVTFEVLTVVTVKTAVFWDIKTQFIPHRKHITSLLQSPDGLRSLLRWLWRMLSSGMCGSCNIPVDGILYEMPRLHLLSALQIVGTFLMVSKKTGSEHGYSLLWSLQHKAQILSTVIDSFIKHNFAILWPEYITV
jgi:hypothetical protein